MVKYYLKKTNEAIEVETIDDSLLNWYIFKIDDKKNSKMKVQNPITNENKSMHYATLINNKANIRKIIDGIPSPSWSLCTAELAHSYREEVSSYD